MQTLMELKDKYKEMEANFYKKAESQDLLILTARVGKLTINIYIIHIISTLTLNMSRNF